MAGSVEATPPAGGRTRRGPRIGVLAVQGDFEAHCDALERLGARAGEVRRPGELDGLDGLVIPGGESTTIEHGIEAYGLEQPMRDFVARGRPVLGTCAGLIMLDRAHLGLMDIEARRNAFGRQVRSFEQDVHGAGPRRRAAARRVHPRAVDRARRATGWRCWPRSTAIRSWRASATCSWPPSTPS